MRSVYHIYMVPIKKHPFIRVLFLSVRFVMLSSIYVKFYQVTQSLDRDEFHSLAHF